MTIKGPKRDHEQTDAHNTSTSEEDSCSISSTFSSDEAISTLTKRAKIVTEELTSTEQPNPENAASASPVAEKTPTLAYLISEKAIAIHQRRGDDAPEIFEAVGTNPNPQIVQTEFEGKNPTSRAKILNEKARYSQGI